jgi:hypothetical protein
MTTTTRKRTSIIFYEGWYNAMTALPPENRAELFTCIMNYGLKGIEPSNLSPLVQALWAIIKLQIDTNDRKRFERMNQMANAEKPTAKTKKLQERKKESTKERSKEDVSESESENESENESKSKSDSGSGDARMKRADPPTKVSDKDEEEKTDETPQPVIPKEIPEELSIEERQLEFLKILEPYVPHYGHKMVTAFFDYWGEPARDGKHLRFELQPFWSLPARLRIWQQRSEKYDNNNNYNNPKNSRNCNGNKKEPWILRLCVS